MDGDSAVEHGDVGYAEYRERGEEREGDETGLLRRKRAVTWEGTKRKVMQGAIVVWDLLLSTSYVLAIICMMVSGLCVSTCIQMLFCMYMCMYQ